MKVLCITGWCRNGSRIIGNILNETPGYFHVGEMHFLWKNSAGKGANNLCGCGDPLTECPVWAPILPLCRPGSLSANDFAEVVMARQRACVRTRHTWRVLARRPSEALEQHRKLMARTYHAIAERMGAEVIVDMTKMPGEAALLPFLEGITPYFVHLVRGHEDFDLLLKLCQTDPAANPMRGREIELHTNHTVTGNPDRFHAGRTAVRERDDAWKTVLTKRARHAATVMSFPLSKRYGYMGGADGSWT